MENAKNWFKYVNSFHMLPYPNTPLQYIKCNVNGSFAPLKTWNFSSCFFSLSKFWNKVILSNIIPIGPKDYNLDVFLFLCAKLREYGRKVSNEYMNKIAFDIY